MDNDIFLHVVIINDCGDLHALWWGLNNNDAYA